MKVLHCLNSPHIGGIERLVIELAIAQTNMGIAVSVMLDIRKGQYYDYLKAQKIPILDSHIHGGYDINPSTYFYLKKQFNGFDLIHLHSFSIIRSWAAYKSNAKVVYTLHGLSKGIRRENILKYKLREFIKTFLINRVDILIANSNYTLELAKMHYGLHDVSKETILNGIKLPSSSSLRNNENKLFTVGLVSRFTERKRIDRLINAFNLFKNKGGIGKLVLLGDGVTYSKIEEMVYISEFKSNIELLGYKNNVEDYYQDFDICVFPSQNEPFGLVAVEAYLHGKSVLAFSDSGGLKEVIKPIEPENIVDNEEALASSLLYWSQNTSQLASGSEKRMAYAQKNFSVTRMANDYKTIYDQISIT